MKFSYFPGCTLKNKAKDLDEYARKSAEVLGVTLEEIEDWQCCGGVFTTSKDEIATKLSSVRILKAAQAKEQALVTVCSACLRSFILLSSPLHELQAGAHIELRKFKTPFECINI